MTATREPLRSWRYPEKKVLEGDVFPAGKPPFAPFPTVTSLLNSNLCPVAALHEFLHGDHGALMGQYPMNKRGDLFHSFVSSLKGSIRQGSLSVAPKGGQASEMSIRNFFMDHAARNNFQLGEASDIWNQTVEPWVRRKLESGELGGISSADTFSFEIAVANPKLPIELAGGIRHYPLNGRIDEMDLKNRRLIERTTKVNDDGSIPLLKDYQCWMLWRLLRSIPKEQLPTPWRALDFDAFSLVVETPLRDYVIPKDNPHFVEDTHRAYAWINDITISDSPGVFAEVYGNAACSRDNPHPDCAHVGRACFGRGYPHPRARPEMKRVFQQWYRLLLWERMWQVDLWSYQVLLLERKALLEEGYMSEAQVLSRDNNKTVLRITSGDKMSIRGYDQYTLIAFGTLHCGKRVGARLKSVADGKVVMEVHDSEGAKSKNALLLHEPPEPSSPLLQPPPGFLIEQSQQGLHKIQRAGVIKDESADVSSVVQLLESVFGTRDLKRGRD